MAKAKRRRFRGFGFLPNLKDIKLSSNVSSLQVLAGVAVGFVGIVGVKYAAGKIKESAAKKAEADQNFVEKFLLDDEKTKTYLPLIASSLVGGLAFVLQAKKNPGRATAHLLGAAATGAALFADNKVRSSDWGRENFYAGYGLLTDDRARLGMLQNDPYPQMSAYVDDSQRHSMRLAQLAEAAAEPDEGDMMAVDELLGNDY